MILQLALVLIYFLNCFHSIKITFDLLGQSGSIYACHCNFHYQRICNAKYTYYARVCKENVKTRRHSTEKYATRLYMYSSVKAAIRNTLLYVAVLIVTTAVIKQMYSLLLLINIKLETVKQISQIDSIQLHI